MTDEDTQTIDYRDCPTIQIPKPTTAPTEPWETPAGPGGPSWRERARETARRAWTALWPPLVGVVLGVSAAVLLWLLALVVWLDLS